LSSKRKIESILSDVNNLGDVEKMLLYLRLPTGFSESDVSSFTKSSPSGPNSNREEHTKAYNWICSHLEESPDTSMPKQDVYEEYKAYCDSFTISAVCPADFGKIMKGVFPNMKRRRLGTRGKSRYPYKTIIKCIFVRTGMIQGEKNLYARVIFLS
ncbi:putative DNA-binding protein RFX5-like, partial [Apostichopus japonicus]